MNLPKILNGTSLNCIDWLQASSNYTFLFLADGQRLLSGYTLTVFEELVDNHMFIRVDRSNLVNRYFIECISKDGIVHLKNSRKLHIPRRRKSLLMNQYPNLFRTQTTI